MVKGIRQDVLTKRILKTVRENIINDLRETCPMFKKQFPLDSGAVRTNFKDGFYAQTILVATTPLVLKIFGTSSPEIARLLAAIVICFPLKLDE